MHVAYVCADPGVPVFGFKGASVHVQEIVRAWRSAGATVTVYCTRQGTDRPDDLADLDVVEMRPSPATGARREQEAQVAAIRLADRILGDGCTLVYERYSLFSPVLSSVSDELQVPSVLEVNAPLIEEQKKYRELYDTKTADGVLARNAGAADVVACVSEPVLRWVRHRVPAAKTLLSPNGVNTTRITPRPPGRRNRDRLTVAFVGTLKPWHGVPDLLQAAALANRDAADPNCRWRVRIIGDGPGRDSLERLAGSLGVETDFTGAVIPAAVPGLLHECDAAAAPYPRDESATGSYFSPLKLYEYMAAAMPIIASDTGQIRSILNGGRHGILVPAGEPGPLAQALTRLAADPDLSDRLGASARAEAVRSLGWDGVLARITANLHESAKATNP